ncbi:hypothetical protein JOM56_000475, partial [Amanita muscaria]
MQRAGRRRSRRLRTQVLIIQLLSIPQDVTPFRLISLSSSTRTIFNSTHPIQPTDDWKSLLTASNEKANLPLLTERLSKLVQDEVLVDNTSSEDVAGLYPSWLEKGIHVVTPNKKAFCCQDAQPRSQSQSHQMDSSPLLSRHLEPPMSAL